MLKVDSLLDSLSNPYNNKVSDKLVFANWKMNLVIDEVLSFCQKLVVDDLLKYRLVLAPPAIYLSVIEHLFPSITLAAQDISCIKEDFGPYTGEVSGYMLKSIKVKYCIVGHYERRRFFAENDNTILQKTKNCLKNNIIPIICFSEQNIGDDIIEELKPLDDNFSSEDFVIYAYEPYWAIGTGDFKFDIISSNIEKITNYLSLLSPLSKKSLIYGGSINSKNITQFSKLNINGFLVGNASLKIDELFKIVKNI
jgi:triosephosphate isomerase